MKFTTFISSILTHPTLFGVTLFFDHSSIYFHINFGMLTMIIKFINENDNNDGYKWQQKENMYMPNFRADKEKHNTNLPLQNEFSSLFFLVVVLKNMFVFIIWIFLMNFFYRKQTFQTKCWMEQTWSKLLSVALLCDLLLPFPFPFSSYFVSNFYRLKFLFRIPSFG